MSCPKKKLEELIWIIMTDISGYDENSLKLAEEVNHVFGSLYTIKKEISNSNT